MGLLEFHFDARGGFNENLVKTLVGRLEGRADEIGKQLLSANRLELRGQHFANNCFGDGRYKVEFHPAQCSGHEGIFREKGRPDGDEFTRTGRGDFVSRIEIALTPTAPIAARVGLGNDGSNRGIPKELFVCSVRFRCFFFGARKQFTVLFIVERRSFDGVASAGLENNIRTRRHIRIPFYRR